MLVNDPDSPDEPTEVGIIDVWKDAIENTRAFTINIIEPFPGFVSARDLIFRIPGCPTERRWQKLGDACNGGAVVLPGSPGEYGPWPDTRTVVFASIRSRAPQVEEEVR
jgi:hypothetical protein